MLLTADSLWMMQNCSWKANQTTFLKVFPDWSNWDRKTLSFSQGPLIENKTFILNFCYKLQRCVPIKRFQLRLVFESTSKAYLLSVKIGLFILFRKCHTRTKIFVFYERSFVTLGPGKRGRILVCYFKASKSNFQRQIEKWGLNQFLLFSFPNDRP